MASLNLNQINEVAAQFELSVIKSSVGAKARRYRVIDASGFEMAGLPNLSSVQEFLEKISDSFANESVESAQSVETQDFPIEEDIVYIEDQIIHEIDQELIDENEISLEKEEVAVEGAEGFEIVESICLIEENQIEHLSTEKGLNDAEVALIKPSKKIKSKSLKKVDPDKKLSEMRACYEAISCSKTIKEAAEKTQKSTTMVRRLALIYQMTLDSVKIYNLFVDGFLGWSHLYQMVQKKWDKDSIAQLESEAVKIASLRAGNR